MSLERPPPPAHIVTAEDRYQPHPDQPDHTPAEAVVFRLHRHGPDAPAPLAGQLKGWPEGQLDKPVAVPRVDHGRWLADCPFRCNSAQYVAKTDPRFFCINCANGGTNKWVPVAWPGELDVAAVEAALGVRPEAQHRNWRPGETVGDLQAESADHGVV